MASRLRGDNVDILCGDSVGQCKEGAHLENIKGKRWLCLSYIISFLIFLSENSVKVQF